MKRTQQSRATPRISLIPRGQPRQRTPGSSAVTRLHEDFIRGGQLRNRRTDRESSGVRGPQRPGKLKREGHVVECLLQLWARGFDSEALIRTLTMHRGKASLKKPPSAGFEQCDRHRRRTTDLPGMLLVVLTVAGVHLGDSRVSRISKF
ncbi:hypothetical protein LIA77_09299 [Sarocladium implicatum]|nr:hypothetical protein LIA77_09299 [Sarocladium implicatum]